MIYNRPELVQIINGMSKGTILDYPYSGTVETVDLPRGTYKLECWGAQGGNMKDGVTFPITSSGLVADSGLGGYSVGTLTLKKKTKIFIYAGGQGEMPTSAPANGTIIKGGFNGGGGGYWQGTSEPANGGGGGSDIRIGTDNLYARVIVAGGGGGSGEDSEVGGYGGGLTGGAGGGSTSLQQASQTQPGTNSSFGQGCTGGNGGGPGGGWYGGASTNNGGSNDNQGGCGGSGYVYTAETYSNYPNGCLLNSDYYLTDATTIAGNESFLSPTGENETGHSGDGYVRITVI